MNSPDSNPNDQTGESATEGSSGDLMPDLSSPGESNEVASYSTRYAEPVTDSFLRRRIGPYKILQKIGEGGMGSVYMAEQDEPIRRRVALKVIRAAKDSEQIIARFEAERQALAMMDHPNIARIFDAGADEDGSPYFVMELVQGIPITEYCDRHQLSIDERLRLLIPVCQAIQHAHLKGIIHRDLKPSNVLVGFFDGDPVPKVIDFGLAKATQHSTRLTDKTMFTEFGNIVGTLQYMSPEQADLDQLDVDTRSDIYSLGVILYELLTGSTPLDKQTVGQNALLKVLQLIQEHDPPRPSNRLSSSRQTATEVSQRRAIKPDNLHKILKGELDWIVMKSLEKKRSRRYETATDFVQDIQRYLNREAVVARPPSTWYRFRKYVSKHKVWVGAATAIASLLLIATIISGSLAKIAIDEKQRANEEKQKTEKTLARTNYYLAMSFWSRDRVDQAIPKLDEIPPQYRYIETRIAREQFAGNSKLVDSPADPSSPYVATLSPNGKWVASTGDGSSILITEIETGRVLHRFGEFNKKDSAQALAFHPDGHWIATGRAMGRVQAWDIESGTLVFDQADRKDPVRALQFSPDEKTLAAAGGYAPDSLQSKEVNPIHVWSVEDQTNVTELLGHTAWVTSIAFVPDSSRLVSGSADFTFRVWDIATETEVVQQEIRAYATSLAVSPSGTYIAIGTGVNRLELWNFDKDGLNEVWRQVAPGYEGNSIDSVAFSPDEKKIVTGGFDQTVKIWDIETGNLRRSMRGHHDVVVRIQFGPDSDHVFSASRDGTARIWKLGFNSESRVLSGFSQSVNAIAFSPDSQWLAAAGGENPFDKGIQNSAGRATDNSLRLWNMDSGESRRYPGHTGPVTDVEFNPVIADSFVSASADGTIRFWDRGSDASVTLDDAHTGERVTAIAIHPDGKKLVSAGDDGVVRVWQFDSRTEEKIFSTHGFPVKCLEWSRDGRFIATVEDLPHAKITVWNANSGEAIWSQSTTSVVFSIAFSPDGNQLAASANDGVLIYDNLKSGELLWKPNPNRLGLYFVDYYFDSNEPRLLTGGREGFAWLLDTETQEELAQLEVNGEFMWKFVYDGKFSPDGSRIAVACRDGTIRIWDASRE